MIIKIGLILLICTRVGVGYEFQNNPGVGLRVIPGITNVNAGEGDIFKDRNFVVLPMGNYTQMKREK